MPDNIEETKDQMKSRHKRELKELEGYEGRIKRWGAIAGAIVAIFSLSAIFSQHVWPWCVRAALVDVLEAVHENTLATNGLKVALEKQTALLEATIKATDERMQSGAIQDEKLRGSLEALRNEVRLRHGVSSSSDTFSSALAGGGRSIPITHSRQQRIQTEVQQADSQLEQAKKLAQAKDVPLKESVAAQLAN